MKQADSQPPRTPFDHFRAGFEYDAKRAAGAFADFRPRLIAYFCRRRLYQDSEDLTSEVVSRASAKFKDFPVDNEPERYLFNMAFCIAHEAFRRRPEPPMLENTEVCDKSPSVESILATKSEFENLKRLCAKVLKPREFDWLQRYYGGEPDARAELAAELNCTRNALGVRIYELVSKLRVELARERRGRDQLARERRASKPTD